MNSWCRGCIWGIDTGTGTYCPFVVGSCVRVPGTISKPDPERVRKAMIKSKLNWNSKIQESKK